MRYIHNIPHIRHLDNIFAIHANKGLYTPNTFLLLYLAKKGETPKEDKGAKLQRCRISFFDDHTIRI